MSGTKILFLLIKVYFHRERGLWKMFGYKSCREARPWHEVASADGGDEVIFDGAEGFPVEVLGKFAFFGVIA